MGGKVGGKVGWKKERRVRGEVRGADEKIGHSLACIRTEHLTSCASPLGMPFLPFFLHFFFILPSAYTPSLCHSYPLPS